MTKIVYRDNDNLITVTGLRDISAGGDYLNSASVTANLYDEDGSLVTPTGGITLSHVSGSDGDYEGVIQSSTSLAVGPNYRLEIDASQAGVVAHWELEAEVVERQT